MTEDLRERILKVKMFILDVDGVLTDGRIVLGNYGDELKFFDVQDGMGIVLLRRAGLKTVIVTSKHSRINHRRARELKVAKLYQKAGDKLRVYEKILKKFRLKSEECCFIGDDLVDLPVMKRAGFAVAVQNAVEDVKGAAHYVTERAGGRGAVREAAELILKTQGHWQEITKLYHQ
jgi:3-deoxy-D-manno-octulosonate 8-phosphate phosphatase (KDO 8-P phosphatase)